MIAGDFVGLGAEGGGVGVGMGPGVVVLAEDVFAMGVGLAGEEGEEGFSLEAIGGRGDGGGFAEGGGEVGEFGQGVDAMVFFEDAGEAHDEGDADGGVVEMGAFEVNAMVTEHLSMVGHEDDEGVVALAGVVEGFEDATHFVIDVVAHGVVGGGDVAFVVIGHGAGVEFTGGVVGPFVVELLEAGFVFEFAFPVIGERHVCGFVFFEVIGGGVEGVMGGEAVEGEEPGVWGVGLGGDEVDGFFGAPGGLVMFGGDAVFDVGVGVRGFLVEFFPGEAFVGEPLGVGIVVAPIRLRVMGPVEVFVGVTVVDAGFDFMIGAGGEVEFSGETAEIRVGAIAEDTGEEVFVGGHLLAVLAAASGGGVSAGEEGGAAGRADGGLGEGVGEGGAFGDEAVEVGGVDVGVTERLDGIEALLVGAEPEDVCGFVDRLFG